MSHEGKGGSRQGKGTTSGSMNIEQGKSRKNPLGPACMSEINGIIAEARTKEPFPIGSHEGEYFDKGYPGYRGNTNLLKQLNSLYWDQKWTYSTVKSIFFLLANVKA